ncbi:PaaI family thioesterase [Alteribacter natronophilus]|uniref:PaaI family thioesterase n=1 Tax=Alteribacter natronophilus TaxID=2583810 RepID=UPI00110E6AE5|nr:PaaI family thioesterase [Alteribacter natronophilus]TMW74024.1 PaaI family thioesterase [Alteribacter natronophilus]
MDPKQLSEKAIQAAENHQTGTDSTFLYSFLDFSFEYLTEEEKVRITCPVSEVMFNPIGFLHGGIVMYIADTAMAHLCASVIGSPSVSLEVKTQFFRTAREGTIEAEAYFTKRGGTIQFAECMLRDEKGSELAKVSGTFYTMGSK